MEGPGWGAGSVMGVVPGRTGLERELMGPHGTCFLLPCSTACSLVPFLLCVTGHLSPTELFYTSPLPGSLPGSSPPLALGECPGVKSVSCLYFRYPLYSLGSFKEGCVLFCA